MSTPVTESDSASPLSRNTLTSVALVALWLGTRALMLWLYTERHRYIVGDVAYYFNSLSAPDTETLREYPLPIVWFLRLVHLISGDRFPAFEFVFAVAMVLFDIIAVLVLARRSKLSAGYWVLFTAAIGPLLWVRLDIMVALAICISLSLLGSSDHAAGAFMAVAAGLKLWPAALIAPIASPRRAGLRRLTGFAVAGLVLGLASLLFGGWTRSLSPLGWQSDRGLQVEAVPATWPMALHGFPDSGYTVSYTGFNAYEVFGVSVPYWLHVSALAFLVAWVLIALMSAWLWWQQHRLPASPVTSDTAHRVLVAQVSAVLAAILLLLVANKTLSPQYMFWLAGPLALGVGLPRSVLGRSVAYLGGSAALIAAALTQAVYPITYGSLVQPYQGGELATALLVVRNLLLLGLAVGGVVIAFLTARRIGR
ncbi:MAG: hypothetical protein LBH11_00200 [Propionibacteriaceae bacterium]|jgi:hypothetical protein|nr:hypothetical protein [Propionibacteriaceae bacterium]